MDRHTLPNRQELVARAQTPQSQQRQYVATGDINRTPPGEVITRWTEAGADLQGYIRDINVPHQHALRCNPTR
jgi:hypothetical protein